MLQEASASGREIVNAMTGPRMRMTRSVGRTGPERNFSFRRARHRPSRGVSLRAILCVLLLCAGRRAWADRALRVSVDDGVPFAAAELTDALRVRLAPTGAPIDVQVALD